MHRDFIVLCPSYRAAVSEWLRIRSEYPVWVQVSRNPLTLTSCTGAHYILRSEQAGNRLKGFHGEFISPQELEEHASAMMKNINC